MDIPLICCCAEYLPFEGDSFDLVVANNVLEHLPDQKQMVRESFRVLTSPGTFFSITTNRFTLGPEPHVRLWGVGFLPRRWMEPYVRLIRGIPYRFIHSLSYFELCVLLRNSPFQDYHIFAPSISAAQVSHMTAKAKTLAQIYSIGLKMPILSAFLFLVSPLLCVLGFKQKNITKGKPGLFNVLKNSATKRRY